MTDEATICAAAYFRTMGKDVTTAEEFVMSTSLEMKWMSPSDSKLLLSMLISRGILIRKGDYIRPSSDLDGIDVPLAYKPSPELMESIRSKPKPVKEEAPAKDMFHVLMECAVKNGMAGRDFVQSCNKTSKRLGIDIGAAALIVMRDNGIDIAPYVEDVYNGLRAA